MQTRRRTREETARTRFKAFDSFSRSDGFASVLKLLNLEHVARLMMCSRSLREIGQGVEEWEGAVQDLYKLNKFNYCPYCSKPKDECSCPVDEKDIYHDLELLTCRDPRIKYTTFASFGFCKQFGLLYQFHKECISNLLALYGDFGDLNGNRFVGFGLRIQDEEGHSPEKILDDCEIIEHECPARWKIFERITELDLAVGDLNCESGGPYWNRDAFLGYGNLRTINSGSHYDCCASGVLEHAYETAQDMGMKFCSDEHLQMLMDDLYERSCVQGLGPEYQDAINLIAKQRSIFGSIAGRLGPLPEIRL